MKSRQRRLKAIELTLTPKQVVVVWLRNALQAGTFKEGARHSPPYRGKVANAVYQTVRSSMKGQPELLVERAILQARREADLLYQLIINANLAVLESTVQREREYILLLGYLSAEMNGRVTKDRVDNLRRAVLMFVESVIVLDAAIAQTAADRFNGQPLLFRDSEAELAEELQMAIDLSTWFNELAVAVGATEINLEDLRTSLQVAIDQRISIWVNLARIEMLNTFGKPQEMQGARDQQQGGSFHA